MEKGKIVQVMGPVVDVEFENQYLPEIKDALTTELNGKKVVMEVAQHIGTIQSAASCWLPAMAFAEIWKLQLQVQVLQFLLEKRRLDVCLMYWEKPLIREKSCQRHKNG